MKTTLITLLILLTLPTMSFAGGGHDHGEKEKAAEEHGHDDGHGHEEGHKEEESRISIPDEKLSRFGLKIVESGPGTIVEGIPVSGRIVPVDDKLAHVSPRFSGVVKEVRAKVGDVVKPDAPLALIQNNQNLQTFSVSSAIPGVVIKRHATLGEAVSEDTVLFTVTDLSEVWAELAVYKQDVDRVSLNQKAKLNVASHLGSQEGSVVFFSPVTEEKTQSRVARVLLKNPDPHFSPGAFVSGILVTDSVKAEIVVENNALQKVEGKDVIFIREHDSFELRTVTLGRSDESVTEVLMGLKAGEKYFSGKTFLLKAELGKSEAEHEH